MEFEINFYYIQYIILEQYYKQIVKRYLHIGEAVQW